MEKMFTPEMLAKEFNVSVRTIVRLIEKRELRALRVGRQWRIRKQWLDEWMARNTSEIGESAG